MSVNRTSHKVDIERTFVQNRLTVNSEGLTQKINLQSTYRHLCCQGIVPKKRMQKFTFFSIFEANTQHNDIMPISNNRGNMARKQRFNISGLWLRHTSAMFVARYSCNECTLPVFILKIYSHWISRVARENIALVCRSHQTGLSLPRILLSSGYNAKEQRSRQK